MSVLKVPYNFVPLNKKVVMPAWASAVSHDIPFADGESGELELTIRAHSPIFIKHSEGKKKDEERRKKDEERRKKDEERRKKDEAYEFCHFNGKYLIPGSSTLGMLRNTLEILSFGRMASKVQDDRYALRDLAGSMKDQYLGEFQGGNIQCGWLQKTENKIYEIQSCGTPGRISHAELDRSLGTNFEQLFSRSLQSDREKSARYKYEQFGNRLLDQKTYPEPEMNANRAIYSLDPSSEKVGTLVFTGQPSPRQQKPDGKWMGKHLEFIFFQPERPLILDFKDRVIEDFFFAYHDHDRTRQSYDWKHWSPKLKRGEKIPVFFKQDENGRVKHLGLSYLYKLPYKYSVKEAIEQWQLQDGYDLAETIFGHVEMKAGALKSRVQVGHAFSENAQAGQAVSEVLSSPKASFFPTYMRQKVNRNGKVNRYVTFMDDRPEIAGWKRYPIRKSGVINNPPPNDNADILTHFKPLKAGAEFKLKIRYHNLRPMELGALISAITFHGTRNTYHRLGMGKPLGYGKVTLNIDNVNVSEEKQKQYLSLFEAYMDAMLGNKNPKWHQSEQVRSLVCMAQEPENDRHLGYMALEDHRKVKKNQEGLQDYPTLSGLSGQVKSLINASDLQQMARQLNKEEQQFAPLRDRKQLAEEQEGSARKRALDELETYRSQLLKQLDETEEEWKTKRKQQKEEEEKKKAQKGGVDLDDLEKVPVKKRFDELKKRVESYAEALYGKKVKEIVAENPKGYLPDDQKGRVVQAIHSLHTQLPKNEKKQWEKPFRKNAKLKKIAEWIGEDQAKGI